MIKSEHRQCGLKVAIASIFFATLLSVHTSSAALQSQNEKQQLTGTILTPDGLPAQNATVILLQGNRQTQSKTTTDEQGKYVLEIDASISQFFSRVAVYHSSGVIDGKHGFGTYKFHKPLDFRLEKADVITVNVKDPNGDPINEGTMSLKSFTGHGASVSIDGLKIAPPVKIVNGAAEIAFAKKQSWIGLEIETKGYPRQFATWSIEKPEVDIKLQRRCSLKGKINDDTGLGFEGVRLKLSVSNRGKESDDTTTANSMIVDVKPDGTFETNDLIGGKLKVQPQRTSQSKWYIKENIYPEMAAPVVVDQESTVELSLTMKRAVWVKGKVTGPDGAPQPNVILNLEGTVETDDNGEYSGYFKPGVIHGQVQKTSKGMIARGGRFGGFYITVPSDEKEFVAPDIQFDRAAPISGVFVDAAGNPIAGASVVATWTAPTGEGSFSPAFASSKTDGLGKFVLEKTNGKVVTKLTASSDAYAGTATVRPGGKRDITIRARKRKLMAINVSAVSEDGKPIPEATFEFWSHRNSTSSVVFFDQGRKLNADSKGKIKTPVSFGRELKYSVIVSAPGYSSHRTQPISAPRKGDLTLGPFKLKASSSIRGQVVDSLGKPVVGAKVWSFSAKDPRNRSSQVACKTDSAGQFELTEVAPQSFFYFVEHPNYRFTGKRISIGSTKPTSVKLALISEPSFDEPVTIIGRGVEQRHSSLNELLSLMLEDEKAQPSDFTLLRIVDSLAKFNRQRAVQTLKRFDRDERRLTAMFYAGEIDSAVELARTLQPTTAIFTITSVVRGVSSRNYHPGVEVSKKQKLQLLVEATSLAAQLENIDDRVSAMSSLATQFRRLGDRDSERSIVEKIRLLGTNQLSDIAAQSYARAIAATDPSAALKSLKQIDREFTRGVATGDAAGAAGFGGHQAVEKLLQAANENADHAGLLKRAVFELAKMDLDKTVAMVDAAEDRYQGMNKAASYGIIAMAVYQKHPDRAKELLRTAFEMVGNCKSQYKDRETFALLRYAQTVDPGSTGEYWWRMIADHGGPNPRNPNRPPEKELQERRASSAILLQLYGQFPDLATQLTEPLFQYWESVDPVDALGEGTRGKKDGIDFRDSVSTLAAMTLQNSYRTVELMNNWWPAGYERFNRSPDSAWILVAEMLSHESNELSRLISKRLHHEWLLGDDYHY